MFSYRSGPEKRDTKPELEIGKLPVLRVAEIDSVLLHEEPDPERLAYLKCRIEKSACLKNPPIAAKDHGTASHLLLDGVNRLEALRELGARFILIQEVDLKDESLVLSTWHHAVEGLNGDDMIERLSSGLAITPLDGQFTPGGDFVPHFEDDCICLIVLIGGKVYGVHAPASPQERLRVVTQVVDVVHTAGNRDRVSYTNMRDLAQHYQDFSALVCYQAFPKEDLLRLALKGHRFPSGVTRFSVPKRALSFNIALSFLRQGESAEAKQRELEEILRRRIREKRIRFYVEPTFHFDD